MDQRGFDHLIHQIQGWIERSRSALSDVSDLAPAQSTLLYFWQSQDVAAIDADAASGGSVNMSSGDGSELDSEEDPAETDEELSPSESDESELG